MGDIVWLKVNGTTPSPVSYLPFSMSGGTLLHIMGIQTGSEPDQVPSSLHIRRVDGDGAYPVKLQYGVRNVPNFSVICVGCLLFK